MLASFLIAFRKRMGITQKQLADTLEITNTMMCFIERGKKQMSHAVFEKFLLLYASNFTEEELKKIEIIKEIGQEEIGNNRDLFLDAFINKTKISVSELAKNLGFSETYIDKLRIGGSPITAHFATKFLSAYAYLLDEDDRRYLRGFLDERDAVKNLKISDSMFMGKLIKDFRFSRRIRQTELANNLGVSSNAISMVEKGKVQISYQLFQTFLEKYGNLLSFLEKRNFIEAYKKQSPTFFISVILDLVKKYRLSSFIYELGELSLDTEVVDELTREFIMKAREYKKSQKH